MLPPKFLLAGLLVFTFSGVFCQVDPGSANDPRCNKCNDPSEEREFEVEALGVFGEGVYETDIVPDEKFHLDGTFTYKQPLTSDLPVALKLVKDSDGSNLAAFSDTLQGLIDKNPGVISNLNCFLNRPLRLPMDVLEEPLVINGPIFPKHFPCGFATGSYTLYLFQLHKDEDRCGNITVQFRLIDIVKDEDK